MTRLGSQHRARIAAFRVSRLLPGAVPSILLGPAARIALAICFSALEPLTEPIPKLAPRQVL